jgi:hypothetical protein
MSTSVVIWLVIKEEIGRDRERQQRSVVYDKHVRIRSWMYQ